MVLARSGADLVRDGRPGEREFFIGNLVVRIHLIIEIILVDRPCEMELLLLASECRIFSSLYRDTSPIRKRIPLGPYRRPTPRVLGGS
jgi:hypothetical protein